MKPYYQDDLVTVHHGDCLEVMRSMPDESVHAIVTDPPYGLGFMGKAWDDLPPGLDFAVEAFRVLKPGGHILAFGGTRTWHRLAVAVEDAGFEIRDSIAWLYGSGFPKSLDVSKAIDKQRDDRAEVRAVCAFLLDAHRANPLSRREIDAHFGTANIGGHWFTPNSPLAQCPTWDQWLWLRDWLNFPDDMDAEVWRLNGRKGTPGNERPDRLVSEAGANEVYQPSVRVINAGKPATDAAREWQGWGTALKPAFEPVVVGRKPLIGTVAANVLVHGTGAINVDGCRVDSSENLQRLQSKSAMFAAESRPWKDRIDQSDRKLIGSESGRFPANVILDESQAAALDVQSGVLTSGANPTSRSSDKFRNAYGHFKGQTEIEPARGVDSGGASRFFPTFRYEAKAPTSERPRAGELAHPTVKPLDLMRWLVRLVTPPGGTILEPFAGSGTTLEAALIEGFHIIGIEREETYLPLIMQRIRKPLQQSLFGDIA
jgi:DNA modification methylase